MIQAIIFDCFGVLTADSWHEFRIGLDKSLQQPASELNHQYCSGRMTREEFLSEVAVLTNVSQATVASIIDNEHDKNVALLAYIAELKQQGYKIGLLSNVASNWIRYTLLSEEEQKLFDAYVFSFEVGMIKPDPRMYHLIAERLHVEPNACVFIDDIEHLAVAAEGIGMQGIVYKSLNQLKNDLSKTLNT